MDSSRNEFGGRIGDDWFLFIEDEHQGPFSRDEIMRKLELGLVVPTDHVWTEGMSHWIPIENSSDFKVTPKSESASSDAPVRSIARPAIAHRPPPQPASGMRIRSSYKLLIVASALILAATMSYLAVRIVGSTIPRWNDVSDEDFASLKFASERELLGAGRQPRLGVGISTVDSMVPRFYVAGNLPDGTEVEVRLDGVSGTMVGLHRFSRMTKVQLEHGWARTAPFHQPDGQPLPMGEYRVTALTRYAGVAVESKKGYFLGGPRDQSYEQKLSSYREQLREQSQQELAELRQITATLEDQLRQTSEHFEAWARLGTRQHQRDWISFSTNWSGLQDQLKLILEGSNAEHAPEVLHQDLYQLAREVEAELSRLHAKQAESMEGSRDPRDPQPEAGIAEEESILQSKILSLKAQIQRSEVMPGAPHAR